MKAVILATNESTDLAPLTDNLPSPMLPLAGKPIMAYTIELLARSGINEIVICLQRMGGSIESWFGTGRRWGVNISYSLQRDSLGDAGAIRWAKNHLDESFLLLPGNTLQDINIEQLIESHQHSNCLATIVTGKRSPIDAQHADEHHDLNEQTGAYIFNQELLDYIPARECFNIQTQFIPLLQQKGVEANYYNHSGYWNPITSFQDLKNAQQAYLLSATEKGSESSSIQSNSFQYPSIPGNRFGNDVWAGKNNIIHPSVRIFPPVVIGDNCQIGRDVELGPFTIVGSNTIIDDEASIRQSTVTDKTYIGKLVNVENKLVTRNLIIDLPTGISTYVTDPFLISEASPPIINNSFRLLADKLLATLLIILLAPLLLVLSIFSLLSTGKVFQEVERIGIMPSDIAYKDISAPDRIELKHFNTRRSNGSIPIIMRWLEKSGLNRLPELFSIVSGTLSLVGVKPLLPEEAELLVEEWQHQRYSFSAGFTGLWYTENSGHDKDETTLVYDIYYVAVRSFKEDLRILLKTPPKWFKNLLYS